MASLFLELDRSLELVTKRLRPFQVRPVKPYLHLSAFLKTTIWLFDAPIGLPIQQLAGISGVKYAEPDEEHVYTIHSTQRVASGSTSLPEILNQIGATRAISRSSGGDGVVILVVDSGVNGARLSPESRAGGWTDHSSGDPWKDDVGHGTMVALIALAVAPNAKIFSVRIKPGPNGGLMKESIMTAVDSLIPLIQANPDLRLVMNNSWGTAGCATERYW